MQRDFKKIYAAMLTVCLAAGGFAFSFSDVFADAYYGDENGASAVTTASASEYRLPVFETSDIHGWPGSESNGEYRYRLAFIADKINDARGLDESDNVRTDRAVLLDGGDIYQGSAESLLLKGEGLSATFDYMQYDAVGIGNHEFDWGLDTIIDDADNSMRDYELDGTEHKNTIPVICSNLYCNGEKDSHADDYVILRKKAANTDGGTVDVKIGVIGFADDYAYSIANALFRDLGYEIRVGSDDYKQLNDLAKRLETEEGCDATIVLVHGAADEIAENIDTGDSCVDLVLGGHTHKNIVGRTEGGLRYMEPASMSYAYCYSELVFEKDESGSVRLEQIRDDSDRAQYVTTSGDDEDFDKLINNDDNRHELDSEVIELTDYYNEKVDPMLEEKIGYITESVTKDYMDGSGKRCTIAANWICDAMAKGSGADIAFINTSGVRTDLYLDEGQERRDVTLGDIYSMLPFEDELYLYDLSFAEFKEVIDYAMTDDGRGILKNVTGIDCRFKDDPEDTSDNIYKRKIATELIMDGTTIWKDGTWTDGWENKRVKVVVPDFLATSNRTEKNGIDNPLATTFKDKYVILEEALRQCVIDVLKAEAAENDGLLHVDTAPHFIYEGGTESSAGMTAIPGVSDLVSLIRQLVH